MGGAVPWRTGPPKSAGSVLVDLSARNKGNHRIREGLIPALEDALRGSGLGVEYLVPYGGDMGVATGAWEGKIRVAPKRSDLFLDEIWLPHLYGRYEIVYTTRENVRVPRRPEYRLLLHLHEHFGVRVPCLPRVRAAAREAIQRYRALVMYDRADGLLFSSHWTAEMVERLHVCRVGQVRSVTYLSGWPDAVLSVRKVPQSLENYWVTIASSDRRDDLVFGLRAWACAALWPGWELHVIGEPRSTSEEGLQGIRFFGWLDDAALLEKLSRARGYLHIGRVEGFGLSVVEALQVGTPVVSLGGSAIRELLVKGCGSIVESDVEAGLAIREVLARPEMRVAAMAVGGEFSWQRTAQGIVNAMEEVMALPA